MTTTLRFVLYASSQDLQATAERLSQEAGYSYKNKDGQWVCAQDERQSLVGDVLRRLSTDKL